MSDLNTKFHLVGVDVAKLKLDIAIDDKTVLTIDNQEESFKKPLKNFPDMGQVCFVMEATGGYEKKLASFLQTKGLAVAVVNAKRVRDYANSMGAYAKNDRIDAQMIRHFAEAALSKDRLRLREPRSETAQQLEGLQRHRHQLVGQRAVEKQHLEAVLNKGTVRSITRIIKQFDKEIGRIEGIIKAHIDEDETLKKSLGQLIEVQGVGEVTVLDLLTQLPELGTITNKEATALVGLAPYCKDSGTKSGRRGCMVDECRYAQHSTWRH